jgi:O-antigen/teichoic acid export membrane protein
LFFNTDTDNFVIGNRLGQEAVGIYAFSNKIANIIVAWSPISVASNIISPIFFGRYTKNKDDDEIDKMFQILNKILYVFFTPILFGLIALNKNFVGIVFGEKYIGAVWILIGVFLYQAFNSYQFPLGLVVYALEKNKINFYSRIFSIYNLIADLILIRFFGIEGVLFATASAITFKNLFIYYWIRRYIKLTWDWHLYVKIIVNGLIMGAIVWYPGLTVNNLWGLTLIILLGLLVYTLLTFNSKIFTFNELQLFNKIAGRELIPIELIRRIPRFM